MNRLSIMALSAALAGMGAGASGVAAQDATGPIETPRCSFACVLTGGGPSDAPRATSAEAAPAAAVVRPDRKRVADRSRHEMPAARRKPVAVASIGRVRHAAIRPAIVRAPAATIVGLSASVVAPMPHPPKAETHVDLQPQAVVSPIVQVESEHRADAAPRREAESAASDLHLETGPATGDVETAGFMRYAPTWDWLITQAHAATVKRPSPYGDLGARSAF